MDIKQLKNVISLFQSSDIAKMEVTENDGTNVVTIKLEKNVAPLMQPMPMSFQSQQTARIPMSAQTEEIGSAHTGDTILDYNLVGEIKSPMVGIFYQSSDPDSEPYVKKGSKVKKGDTLCVIEAMKLMNEIVAERDGEIVEVCAKNNALVEFGQILFKIF